MTLCHRRIVIALLITLCICLSLNPYSLADVKIKFIVINPSETETKTIPVKYPLPNEVKPENVVSSGGLDVDYDVDDNTYYLVGGIDLEPKETKIYEISVDDVWKIPDEKLKLLENYVNEKMVELSEGPSSQMAKGLQTTILERINEIRADQDESQPIAYRVDAFRLNKGKLKSIENDTLILERLAAGEQVDERTVSIVLEMENPYDEEKVLPVKHYLPEGLGSEDIMDSAGFDMSYDRDRNRVFIKGILEMQPKESKKFEIKVRDVWYIKPVEIATIENESEKILAQLVDTEFENLANYLGDEIRRLMTEIKDEQAQDLPLKIRIANFNENKVKMQTAKDYLDRLRSFMLQFELARAGEEGNPSASDSETAMGGGKAEGAGGGVGEGLGTALSKGSLDTVQQRGGGLKGIRGLKGMILVSKSIFRGWKPEVATTWIIILSIIAFLFIFALLFYIVSLAMAMVQKKHEKLKKDEEE